MEIELIAAGRSPHLEAANLRLPEGITLVVGPDRSAQGALLRLIALRWPPSSGRMRVEGRDVVRLSPAERAAYARRVGFAPADRELPSHLRVRSALRYLAALWQVAGTASAEREIERWGLAQVAHRRMGSLSPGERRRVVLAASLLMAPNVWLLEQPFDGLDMPGRLLLRHLLLGAALGGAPRHVVLAQADADESVAHLPIRMRLCAESGGLSGI